MVVNCKRSQVHWPAGAVVVSLINILYSHCSSPLSCINGGLALARETKVKYFAFVLCMYCVVLCVHVCVCAVAQWSEHCPGNQEVPAG